MRNFLNVDNKLLTHTRENLCTTCQDVVLKMSRVTHEKLFESSSRTFVQVLEMLSTSSHVTKYLRNFLNVDNKLLTHTRENLCTTCHKVVCYY